MEETKTSKMTIKDLVYTPLSPTLCYEQRPAEEKKAPVYGQLKLFTWLVQFLTRYWNPIEVPNPVVVYVGAAPGYNIGVLSLLFPDITWHLYDPSPIEVVASDKIKIHQQLFTDNDAHKWKNRLDVFFVSDIRTATGELTVDPSGNTTRLPQDSDIQQNLRLQENWYKIIRPVKSTVKFRFFSPGSGVDSFDYIPGVVYLKVFRPRSSFESGLVFEGYDSVTWDTKHYTGAMNYNNLIRDTVTFINEFDTEPQNLVGEDLTTDWDSVAFISILSDYIYKVSGTRSKEGVIKLYEFVMGRFTTEGRVKGFLQRKRGVKVIGPAPPRIVIPRRRKLKWVNPDIHIIKNKLGGKTFHVIQEGKLQGGSKERGIIPFVESTNFDEYVYAGPAQGFAIVALAKACKLASTKSRKVKCTIFVERSAKKATQVSMAKGLGATVKSIPLDRPGGKMLDRIEMAQRYTSRASNAVMISFGGNDWRIYNKLKSNLSEALSRAGVIDTTRTIWMASGSGTLLKIFSEILPNASFKVLEVGRRIFDDIIISARGEKILKSAINNRGGKHQGKEFYEDVDKEDLPPYDSVPSYDAKVWQFFVKGFNDGDFIMNVASIPGTARPMKFDGSKKEEILY